MEHQADSHDDGQDEKPLYNRPQQRQKWGEAQIKPHTNWGDTFFDLFFVAGAYNLGTLLKAEPTSRGLLYFAGCFFPIQNIWLQKMYYDARFYTVDDTFHRMYEFAILVCLATSVLHIRPVSILSDPTSNVDMFIFAISVAIANILAVGRALEVKLAVVGEQAAKTMALRDMLWYSVTTLFYGVGAIIGGIEYYGSDDDYHEPSSDYGDDYNGTTLDDDHHRFLAASGVTEQRYTSEENDTPIWFVLGGSVCYMAGISAMVLLLPGGGRHKLITVPMNITFVIHRWGEWTMLMLGESVLSLLIVDVTDSGDYYKTFFSGIVSITLLEFLHFRSQPHDPDDHAMRRTKEAGVIFTCLMQIYSAALVVLGTSYKMLLYDYVYEAQATNEHRLLQTPFSRFLAGGDEPPFELDDLRQRVAYFFCGSMAVAWLCSDLMIISHRGMKDNMERCRFSHTGTKKLTAVALLTLRVGLIAFIATLSFYVTEPAQLALIGLVGIMAQVILRVVGTSVFGGEFEHDDDPANATSQVWPNITRPQVEYSDDEDSIEK